MLLEPFRTYTEQDFIFKIATTPEDRQGFWNLRQKVFCEEQGIFEGSDRDIIDETMMPIVCKTLIAGMEDRIVGVVRIDEREPGIWYGSRLAVDSEYRKVRMMSPGVPIRNQQPSYKGFGAIGAGLIYKAVSTANRIGCEQFLAVVQHQNEKFFRRLHWENLGPMEFKGIQHYQMQADLSYYQPAKLAI